jgi:opacity protein-like surface antigen
MRRLVSVIALLGPITGAFAADFEYPTLRGTSAYPVTSPSYARWDGLYFGGQMGVGTAHADFSKATQSLVAFSLRETALENEQHPSQWPVLGVADSKGPSIGGFIGYNAQWDDVILGLELNYNRNSFSADAPNSPISRVTTAGGNTYLVNISGSGSLRISDMAIARARAGWVIGDFLPYATIGFAVGRASFMRSATVSGVENPTAPPTPCDGAASPPCTVFSFTQSDARNSAFVYGWAVGGGIDYALLPNVFLRGEIEYVAFTPLAGISSSLATARVGAGLKF